VNTLSKFYPIAHEILQGGTLFFIAVAAYKAMTSGQRHEARLRKIERRLVDILRLNPAAPTDERIEKLIQELEADLANPQHP
jgi:hypothetical protein